MDKNILDELASKLADAVPGAVAEGAGDLRNELRGNFHAVLQGVLDKMDLVTRDEFDTQRKVLERTRDKLERLQRDLEALQNDTGEESDSNSA